MAAATPHHANGRTRVHHGVRRDEGMAGSRRALLGFGARRESRCTPCPARKCPGGGDRRRVIGLSCRRAVGTDTAALGPSGRIATRGAFLNLNRPARRNDVRGILLHPSANRDTGPRRLTQRDPLPRSTNPHGTPSRRLVRPPPVLLPRSQLVLENLALRQQLAILRRSVRRPRLRPWDRLFWVWLSRCWAGWKDALAIVGPACPYRKCRKEIRRPRQWRPNFWR